MNDLETDLRNILYREDVIGVGPLAETLMDNLPPVYAAGPDLLVALEEAIDWVDAQTVDCKDSADHYWADQARAAIAKAKWVR